MKPRRPVVSALVILGYTLGSLIAVFIVGNLATAVIFGGSQEASWGFALLFTLLAPVALLVGVVMAITRFLRERRRIAEKSEESK